MVNSKELRNRAWNALKGKYWFALLAAVVGGILVSLGSGLSTFTSNAQEMIAVIQSQPMGDTEKLAVGMISGASSAAFIVGIILKFFVNRPAGVGMARYFTKITEGKPEFSEIFYGFKNGYMRNVWVRFLADIKLGLWYLLLVVPGIIKQFEYAIIPYILADEPELESKEVFAKAHELMMGNKWRLFKLEISFIGWFLLGIITFGVGLIAVRPYIETALGEFYQQIKSEKAIAFQG